MSGQRRQLTVLAVLVLLLGATVAWRMLGSSGPTKAPVSRGRARTAAATVSVAQADVDLDLEALERKPAAFSPGRDPFRFYQAPPPQAPPPPPPAPKPQAPTASAVAAAQAQATPPKPRPPSIDFSYLGSFGPKERPIAVFTDQKEIYNAREGDVIKERFVVMKIGYESADIGFVGFPDEPAQRLAVGG